MKVAYVGNEIFLPPEDSEVDKYAFNDLSIGEKENEYDLIYSTNSLPEVERKDVIALLEAIYKACLLYTSPSPRDRTSSRMPSSA